MLTPRNFREDLATFLIWFALGFVLVRCCRALDVPARLYRSLTAWAGGER